MIRVEKLNKSFEAVHALRDISFEMKQGEVVGFLGPNGAGKTTAMRILTGFLPPSSGSCFVADLDVSQHSFEARQKIGYLPESTPLYVDMEVVEYLKYLGSIRGLTIGQIHQNIKTVVQTCGLQKVIGRRIGQLSKGYRQRVGLAQALLHQPEILILDEPTVGLDPNQIVEIRKLIKKIGKERTILLSTHILSEVEQTCERVIIIHDGKIVGQGTPRELMAQTQGGHVYQVGIRGPQTEVQERLGKLSGIQDLHLISSEGGVHYMHMISNEPGDQREALFKFVVKNGWSLLELKKEEVSLEKVFKRLTQ